MSVTATALPKSPLCRGTAGLWICAAILCVAMIGSLAIGPVSIAPGNVLSILFDAIFGARPAGGSALKDAIIVLDIRLPRMVLGVLVGASLGVTGALLQGVFRNPLADPIFVGVSPGAACAAVAFIVFGGALAADVYGLFTRIALTLA